MNVDFMRLLAQRLERVSWKDTRDSSSCASADASAATRPIRMAGRFIRLFVLRGLFIVVGLRGC